MSVDKDLLLRALDNVQAEERRVGRTQDPKTMLYRALNLDLTDMPTLEQAEILGGEFVRITEMSRGPECWTRATNRETGEFMQPGPHPDPMTPGTPPEGTLALMLLAMRYGREVGRLEIARKRG